jgi:uncharacterized protein (TIGR00369 family)
VVGNETLIQQKIVESPLGRLFGFQAQTIAPNEVAVRLPFRPEVTTVGDVVHGGAIAALVDTAAVAAVWSEADLTQHQRGATVSCTVNYLAAGRGQDLIAQARVIQRGRTLCVCEVDVRGADGTSVARALVTYKLG